MGVIVVGPGPSAKRDNGDEIDGINKIGRGPRISSRGDSGGFPCWTNETITKHAEKTTKQDHKTEGMDRMWTETIKEYEVILTTGTGTCLEAKVLHEEVDGPSLLFHDTPWSPTLRFANAPLISWNVSKSCCCCEPNRS